MSRRTGFLGCARFGNCRPLHHGRRRRRRRCLRWRFPSRWRLTRRLSLRGRGTRRGGSLNRRRLRRGLWLPRRGRSDPSRRWSLWRSDCNWRRGCYRSRGRSRLTSAGSLARDFRSRWSASRSWRSNSGRHTRLRWSGSLGHRRPWSSAGSSFLHNNTEVSYNAASPARIAADSGWGAADRSHRPPSTLPAIRRAPSRSPKQRQKDFPSSPGVAADNPNYIDKTRQNIPIQVIECVS